MTETVHVAMYDTFVDWEIGYAIDHINAPEWQKAPGRYAVATVGATADPVTSTGGLRMLPDTTLDDLDPAGSSMLILAGNNIWHTDQFAPFAAKARDFLDAGVPVAAICGATGGLALAGLLDDRAHTSNAAEFLNGLGYAGGTHYVDEPAVTDDDLITATGIAPVHFAREIFRRLDLYETDVLDAWFELYGLRDPAGFYKLANR
ncbi:ThiJ/PfpI domain-containing protein [Rhodococcus sp. RD6.2]|uniref:DJ-1/PfpI family protein n=1 Tax=Rhodococcus sp. RD6.2 TaxID=260936 RepID=UPI00063B922D|nr:DJ-1/PfpI family protein [Rhodococcus sp. RD6.2]CRK52979.1 ThiJ/PfpI domain-containing protein [Rhodococcus sp. RD6.2]